MCGMYNVNRSIGKSFEKKTVVQLVKNVSSFYRTQVTITVFTTVSIDARYSVKGM